MIAISSQFGIDSQQVLHDIGYDADGEPPARISSLVDEYVDNVCHLIEPSYSYVIRDINSIGGSRVVIGDSVVFKSRVIARLLGQCEKVAVFALTIGDQLEEMVRHLVKDRLVLKAAVLDAIGSGATEQVADFVQDRISEMASVQGLCISRRFSPGYCDWKLDQQKNVFRVMNGDSAGVRLTERYLMIPQKSISGIIGIGPCGSNIESYNPCNTCKKWDCPGRR